MDLMFDTMDSKFSYTKIVYWLIYVNLLSFDFILIK